MIIVVVGPFGQDRSIGKILKALMMVGKQIGRFGVGIVLALVVGDCAWGQWPVLQTPVENSVPQYVSPSVDAARGKMPPSFFAPSGQAKAEQQEPAAPAQDAVTRPSPNVLTKKKQSPQPTAKKKEKAKDTKKHKPAPVVDYSIYRDRSQYPIDYRKPCHTCDQGKPNCRCGLKLPGNQGRPYREYEPGGCKCDSRHPWHHPDFSVHWPRPFSAKLDERNPAAASERYAPCQGKRIVDVFDPLATFKLSKYKRQDNGYCGPGADRYGCLGESKLR